MLSKTGLNTVWRIRVHFIAKDERQIVCVSIIDSLQGKKFYWMCVHATNARLLRIDILVGYLCYYVVWGPGIDSQGRTKLSLRFGPTIKWHAAARSALSTPNKWTKYFGIEIISPLHSVLFLNFCKYRGPFVGISIGPHNSLNSHAMATIYEYVLSLMMQAWMWLRSHSGTPCWQSKIQLPSESWYCSALP
jgi:hypothetical protein